MYALTAAVAACAASIAIAQQLNVGCKFNVGDYYASYPGITYSLCPLTNPNSWWTWADPSDFETTNSTYTFNLGYNVAPANMPPACSGLTAPAFQVTTIGGVQTCYTLGLNLNDPSLQQPQFALYDTYNPGRGFQLTYEPDPNQAPCANGVQRSLTLVFLCDLEAPFPPVGPTPAGGRNFIDETNVCNYMAFSRSQAACPLECPVTNGVVCGGNGICAYDVGQSSARCFCNDQYTEADCMTERWPFPSGAVAGSVFGGMLVGALGVAAYSFFAFRGKVAAPSAAQDGFYPS